jgi:hypothetical protein
MVVSSLHKTFRMHSRAERYFWICYQLLLAVASIIGDTLILIASRDKKYFKVNKFLVTIMQHIAVCDITLAITQVLPITVSIIADSWIFGDVLCYAKGYSECYVVSVTMCLICSLTTGRLLLLRKPTRAKTLSRNKAHLVCFRICIALLIYPALMFALGRNDFSFDYRTYDCTYGYNASAWKQIKPATFTISAIVPNIIIITTSVPNLWYLVTARKSANRVRASVPWQGALAVVLTATVFCLSTLPYTVYMVGSPFVQEDHIAHDFINFTLNRYGLYLGMTYIPSNFLIYTLSITSFRRYLYSKLEDLSAFFKSRNTSSGRGDSF